LLLFSAEIPGLLLLGDLGFVDIKAGPKCPSPTPPGVAPLVGTYFKGLPA